MGPLSCCCIGSGLRASKKSSLQYAKGNSLPLIVASPDHPSSPPSATTHHVTPRRSSTPYTNTAGSTASLPPLAPIHVDRLWRRGGSCHCKQIFFEAITLHDLPTELQGERKKNYFSPSLSDEYMIIAYSDGSGFLLSTEGQVLFAFEKFLGNRVIWLPSQPGSFLATSRAVSWDGNRLAYPHRTGFRPVSDQCHAECTAHVTRVNSRDRNS